MAEKHWWDEATPKDGFLSVFIPALAAVFILAAIGMALSGAYREFRASMAGVRSASKRLGERSSPKAKSDLELQTLRQAVARYKEMLTRLEKENNDLRGRLGSLVAEAASNSNLLRQLQQKNNELEERNASLKAELALVKDQLQKASRQAQKAATEAASIRRELGGKVRNLARLLAAAEKKQEELQQELNAAKKELDALKQQKETAEKKAKQLASRLAYFPVAPLSEEQAKARFEQAIGSAEKEKDPARRLQILFAARMALCGSAYEQQITSRWKSELDSFARSLYEQVASAVKKHPDDHRENIRLISDALAKVRGSRYEKQFQRLLDKEKKATR